MGIHKLNAISFAVATFIVSALVNLDIWCDEPAKMIERISLNGIWKFKSDKEDTGRDQRWFSSTLNDRDWEDISVPGTWNEGQNVSVQWNHEGVCWYRRSFDIPKDWKGHRIRIKFLAVYLISDVWLNERHLGTHRGGYTAFEYDISDVIAEHNMLAVRVDNTKRSYQVPGASIDWWNCGGITREVFIEKLPEVFLKNVFIDTADISEGSATVNVRTILSPSNRRVNLRYEVLHKGNILFSKSESFSGENKTQIQILNPMLWSPDSPELYELRIFWQFSEGNWWMHKERFGIRKIEVRNTELYLNGKKIWLQGIALHQDFAGMGSAVTYEAQRSDLERIKKLNANFVRLGHYPFHPYSLDVCDELGLLVWSEIPVWQNSREELASEEMWENWVKPQLDEMIEQYYNHPSIIFWSVANEISQTWNCQPEAPEIINYIKKATEYVRSKDSTRLVSYASAASTGGGTWQFLDVNGKPLHYGWFHSGNVYDIGPEVDKIHSHMPKQPILAVELCGMSFPDNHRGYSEDARFSVEYHDKLLRVDMQHLMIRKDFVCGVTLWTLADLKGGREKGTYGILDRERKLVKHIYETVKNLYSRDPKLLIIDSRTKYDPGEKMEVELWSFNRLDRAIEKCKVHWWIRGKRGREAEGVFETDITADKAKKLSTVSWDIPKDADGFYSFLCTMEESSGNLLFANDYYFDVGSPERPAILWVKAVDRNGKPMEGVTITIDSFPRVTDEFGKVPFLLNGGTYKLEAKKMDKFSTSNVTVKEGETSEIVISLDR